MKGSLVHYEWRILLLFQILILLKEKLFYQVSKSASQIKKLCNWFLSWQYPKFSKQIILVHLTSCFLSIYTPYYNFWYGVREFVSFVRLLEWFKVRCVSNHFHWQFGNSSKIWPHRKKVECEISNLNSAQSWVSPSLAVYVLRQWTVRPKDYFKGLECKISKNPPLEISKTPSLVHIVCIPYLG